MRGVGPPHTKMHLPQGNLENSAGKFVQSLDLNPIECKHLQTRITRIYLQKYAQYTLEVRTYPDPPSTPSQNDIQTSAIL